MDNWLTGVSWKTTWGNKKYRKVLLLSVMSFIAGGFIVGIMYFGSSVLAWIVLLIYTLLMHIMCFELAHFK